MPKPKPSTIKLQVFKGREAKLNKAIFHSLALKGPQTIYETHKQVRVQKGLKDIRYASMNKRIRTLERSSYIGRVGTKKTKAGFEASIYELNAKGFLALLFDQISLDDLILRMDEATAQTILGAVSYAVPIRSRNNRQSHTLCRRSSHDNQLQNTSRNDTRSSD